MSAHGERPDAGAAELRDFPSLQAFGAVLATEQTARRARRRGLRSAIPRGVTLGSVGVGALVITGTAAAGLTALTGSPIPAPLRGDDTVTVLPSGGSRIAGARAADLTGGPPWAVRVGAADGGLVCAGVGQVRDDTLGIVGRDGRFRGLPEQLGAGCVSAPTPGRPIVATRAVAGDRRDRYGTPQDGSTILYGVAGDRLRDVVVRLPDGRVLRPRTSDGGVFVVALRGLPEQTQPVVDLRWRDGEHRRVDLRRLATIPDPEGAAVWSVHGSDVPFTTRRPPGGRRDDGGAPKAPRVGTACFSFVSAGGGSGPVCGGTARGAWVLRPRPGPRPVEGERRPAGWTGPSRTLVVVRSAPGRPPVVSAGGRAWPVRWAGSFGTGRTFAERDVGWAAVLPARIPPSQVRVREQDAGRPVRVAPATDGTTGRTP